MTKTLAGVSRTDTRAVPLYLVISGLAVALFALTLGILRSEAWVPVYARSLSLDLCVNGDRLSTPPLLEVRDGYLVFPERASALATGNLACATERKPTR